MVSSQTVVNGRTIRTLTVSLPVPVLPPMVNVNITDLNRQQSDVPVTRAILPVRSGTLDAFHAVGCPGNICQMTEPMLPMVIDVAGEENGSRL
jgi:hypothetical protein